MKISDLGGETALIKLIRDKYGVTGAGGLALGIGDDAALIRSGDGFIAVTADLLVENTHFRMDINEPYLLGWKSAAVNISDIAAMGGIPTYSFVSIGLPDVEVAVVEAIYEGMRDVSAKYGSVIAGGDTVASGVGIVINVTQLGAVEPGKAARRNGAKASDVILVTNTIGDSRAGLELLLKLGLDEARRVSPNCVQSHLKPEPKVNEARAAVETGKVHSMMDLSDGLAADLGKLCEASGVGARVIADALPISRDTHIAAARLDMDAVCLAAGGGEDYELLLTCDPGDVGVIAQAMGETESSIRVIGEIVEGDRVTLVLPNGEEGPIGGSWEHF